MERTWKPTAAGILCIIAGVPIVVSLGMLVAIGVSHLRNPPEAGSEPLFLLFYAPLVILLIIVGTVDIVGGICALRRRIWGLVLAGSICALIPFVIPGILAIIFVVLGKGEFKAKALVAYERGDACDEAREYDKVT